MDLKLPKLGEGADSGVVVNILVKEGDSVTAGQTVIELENEKAVAPIPAREAGKVTAIRVKVGDKLSVGQTILSYEGGNGGAAAAPAKTEAKPAPAAKPAAKAARPAAPAPEPVEEEAVEEIEEEETPDNGFPPQASPSVRKMADDLGINLRKIKGSEHGGRIVLADVRAYVQRLIRLAAQPKAPAGSSAAPAAAAPEKIDFAQWGPVVKRPMTPLRKVISRRMSENWNAIPHVTQFDDVDVTALNDLRKKHGAAYEAKGGRLTLTPLIIKALVAALKKHPTFNSSLDEAASEIVVKEYYHIGIAVDTDAGLMVPVIRDADKKSLLDLSKELEELAKKARDRKLSGDEMKGGTFTISNQGGIGGAHFTPIVNKPEVAILGLGRSIQKAVVVGGKVEARLMMPIGISYDHRVIDGGTAARFTVDFAQALTALGENDVKL
ncbi:MAG TPA: 2-oxo acid dehydrogenase subunit E2 [Verrucomicrobiae bacterium]|nr:2-oxo acid dehydrogenase subunit E2 [Verrucomicrobiae bacterium]